MKNFFLNPIVALLIGMLMGKILSPLPNSTVDKLLLIIPATALATIFLNYFIRKWEEN